MYYQKEIETMPVEALKDLQSRKLVRQVNHVYENVAYYRDKMDKAGVRPSDIKSVEDLRRLPFLEKEDLRNTYPSGMLAVPIKDCVRIHSTSGTTGKRVIAYYTQHDLDLWEDCVARALSAAGATVDDTVQICFGYGLFTGGMGFHGASQKLGCVTLPMSSGNTERQIQFMQDLGSTVLCCTPSYAGYLADTLTVSGLTPDDIPLKIGIFGAEPWTEEMRASIEKRLGIKAFDIYGLTEISGPGVAFECEEQNGMHINEDHFIAEIINPITGEVLPEGEKGELVLTSIDKEAFPMMRYRTHDICVLKRGKCSCGRSFIKMAKPMGRSDDMMIIRGVNVFPSQIESVLLKEGYSNNYLIEIDRVNSTDTFDVFVEFLPEDFDDTIKTVTAREKRLQSELKKMVGISPAVHLRPPMSLARSDGKAVRINDKRKLL
ncbi:MAG: phenylacetate--CoA ligase [Lachnospiraceae bacterium]|nr:phenylacetate--CoA ligase [Lachnospiraceae bacterium]